jgi:DNA-binding XRE family transcriptional regulator
MVRVGRHLERMRRVIGLSKVDVANKLGCTYSAVYAWESGRNLPDLPTLIQFAEIYGWGDRVGSFFRALGFHNEATTISLAEWVIEQMDKPVDRSKRDERQSSVRGPRTPMTAVQGKKH